MFLFSTSNKKLLAIPSAIELDAPNGLVELGDPHNISHSTQIVINDASLSKLINIAAANAINIDSPLGVVTIGDASGGGNGTNITVDDQLANTLTLHGFGGVILGTSVQVSGNLTFPSAGSFLSGCKGGNATSAAALVPQGNVFHVTGTNTITSINASGIPSGAILTLIFDAALTFTDGNNLKLNGNFVTTADDTITLAYDGTNFYEICRSVN